jgi:DNA mismatch repair protein MutS
MTKTPMMRQYEEAKQACGDALLLFRMGDFYELFHEDARSAAKVLGLTLTSRDKSANPTPMAGFPHHQLESYLAKLIKQGYRVAVCEQMENPQTAKGLVKREVTQVVSPGTIADHELLEPTQHNYLVAIYRIQEGRSSEGAKEVLGIAWADSSTGRFWVTQTEPGGLFDLMSRLNPSEVVLAQGQEQLLPAALQRQPIVTIRPRWAFAAAAAKDLIQQQFQVGSLDGFGLTEFGPAAIGAAGALIDYLRETQKSTLAHFDRIQPFRQSQFVEIDAATWRSLEISQTIRGGQRQGSLLGVIDRSMTPMGSRLLSEWLSCPLLQIAAIEDRLDAVSTLKADSKLLSGLRQVLGEVFDLQRLLARVSVGRSSPRDLQCVQQTLSQLPRIKTLLAGCQSRWLAQLELELDPCAALCQELERALVDACPNSTKDGGFIRREYHAQLDAFRNLAAGGKQWIARYQQQVIEETGIATLKVGYNKVFGYYLETTNAHRDKLPQHYIRKQTLKNAERFITPELKDYEEKVLSADTQAEELELQLFEQLRELVRASTLRLKANADIVATLDCICGLAQLAVERNYCRPNLVADSVLDIVDGRHPVLDIMEPLGTFVPNSTKIDDDHGWLHLITGPNMAGKSTYIRQVALISLLAQIGSFVPARSARVGIVDKIFARVGASDELSRGQSTFMVEMTETARILNTASPRSLVILDEIGRGTSTFDGVSLAWAIVEYLHDQIGCRALFATHYHELTELEGSLNGVCNYNVSVKEWEDRVVFLHKIVRGSADKSYGIHVAQLAGVPGWVSRRAELILKKLESNSDSDVHRDKLQRAGSAKDSGNPTKSKDSMNQGAIQLTLFGTQPHPLIDKLKALDANRLTPIDALQMLHAWKEDLDQQ